MSRLCLVSDTHFGIKKSNEIFLKSQLEFLKKDLVYTLSKTKIKDIYILGDLFDNRNSINVRVNNEVFDLFNNEWSKFNIKILLGNHDLYYTNTNEVNSIKWLSKFDNVEIINKPTVKDNLLLCPWIINEDEFLKYLKDVPKDVNICLGHFDIIGFQMNNHYESKIGLVDDVFYSNFDLTFSGHYHKRSKKEKRGKEIVYIGSPYQLDRNDINENKGICILDTKELKYKFLNNKSSIKFIDVVYPTNLKEEDIKGNIIQVSVKYDTYYNEETFQKYLKEIESYNPSFYPNIKVLTTDLNNKELDLDNVLSSEDLMKEYVNILDINNKEEINNSLLELYNECKGNE